MWTHALPHPTDSSLPSADEELERRRERHMTDLIVREKEFAALKDKLKEVRLRQVASTLCGYYA